MRNLAAVPARDDWLERVLDMVGRPLHEPQRGDDPPAHVQWHQNQVFSGPARVPA